MYVFKQMLKVHGRQRFNFNRLIFSSNNDKDALYFILTAHEINAQLTKMLQQFDFN